MAAVEKFSRKIKPHTAPVIPIIIQKFRFSSAGLARMRDMKSAITTIRESFAGSEG